MGFLSEVKGVGSNLLNSLGGSNTLGYVGSELSNYFGNKTITVSMRDVIANNDLENSSVKVSASEIQKHKTHIKFRKGIRGSIDTKNPFYDSDPTFLSFSLLFDTNGSPLFGGYEVPSESISKLTDMVGDKFDSPSQIFRTFIRDKYPQGSALRYLTSIGEHTRAIYLHRFLNMLMELNKEMSYFWQSIEGLDTNFEGMTDFEKLPIVSDWEFTIKTLESSDLKIYGLFDLYRKAIYDYNYNRQVVPDNLLKFGFTLYINDMRNINVFNDTVTIPLVDNLETGIIMQMTDCKFKPKSGGGVFSSISNTDISKAENSIYIGAKGISYSSVIPWFESKIGDNYETPDITKIVSERIPGSYSKTGNRLNNLEKYLTNIVKGSLKSSAQDLIRKNIPPGLQGSIEELMAGNIMGALNQGGQFLKNAFEDETTRVYDQVEFQKTSNHNDLGNVAGKIEGMRQTKLDVDVYDNVDVLDKPQYLGDVYPEELGIILGETPEKQDVFPHDLGDVIDGPMDLGDVYPKELGNVLDENPDKLDVYPQELGIVIGEKPDKLDIYPQDLGNVIDKAQNLGDVYPTELGDVIDKSQILGDVYPTDLGDVLGEKPNLGDVYPEQ